MTDEGGARPSSRPRPREAGAPPPPREPNRLVVIGAALVVAVAVLGLFSGQRSTERAVLRHVLSGTSADTVVPAGRMPRYSEMGDARRGPNAHMYDGAFALLARGFPGLAEPVVQTAEDRSRILENRATRRAYDGAPPTIPHAVDQRGAPSCLACHEQGARIAGKVAPPMSHERHDSCTQCHVPSADSRGFGASSPPPASVFAGLEAAGEGYRAWPGAPPTIPHSIRMRGECQSCHGVTGPLGIRTPHPDRQSCTQCHVPSAALDQRGAQPSR